MTACCFGLSVFLALFALVAAEALPPDAVPVMCAAICGPIVELSSMCSPKRSLGRLESSHLDREEHPRPVEQIEQIEERFVIIVPAPTTFPPGLLDGLYSQESSSTPISPSPPVYWSQSSSSSSPSSPIWPAQTPASIPPPNYSHPTVPPPAQALPTTSDNLSSTAAETLPAATPTTSSNNKPIISSAATKAGTKAPGLPTTSTTLSGHRTSMVPTILGSDGNDGGETSGWGVTENAEEKCVCLNDSFNVAEIAGLCASCISMIADTQNDMQVIMSVCGFPPQQYSPAKDSLASNIWVKATRPTAAYAGSAKLNGASRSTQITSVGPVIGVAGFVIGALTIL